jgi:serine/threonine protein kinase
MTPSAPSQFRPRTMSSKEESSTLRLSPNSRSSSRSSSPGEMGFVVWRQHVAVVVVGVIIGSIGLYKQQQPVVSTTYGSISIQAPRKLSFSYSLARDANAFPRVDSFENVPRRWSPDLGGLDFETNQTMPSWHRKVDPDDYNHENKYREKLLDAVNFGRLHAVYEHYDDLDHNKHGCKRLKWSDNSHQTCNNFHELALDRDQDDYTRRYLGHGFDRDAWMFESLLGGTVVLKAHRIQPGENFDWKIGSRIFQEALILERTSDSPNTIDMYGHCYTSILVEPANEISKLIVEGKEYDGRGRISQALLDEMQVNDVYPFNNFTTEEKLDVALGMAMGLAALHGHPEGVMTNNDVNLDQFLVNRDGLVKLNDHNSGRVLEWSPANSVYCMNNVRSCGDYRSPEELSDGYVDEKSDVWPLGANIFALLSGLYPYYTEWEPSEVERQFSSRPPTQHIEKIIVSGIKPFLDERYRSRSLIEGRLYEIMEQCFKVDPFERVSSFEVVRHLQETKEMVEQAKREGTFSPEERPQQESLLEVRRRYWERIKKEDTNAQILMKVRDRRTEDN